MNRVVPFLCFASLLPWATRARLRFEPFEIDWDESFEAFVPYPAEVRDSVDQHVQPVLLDIFSDVDMGEEGFYHVFKGMVHRNKPILTSTHFVIEDGVEANCRKVAGTDPHTGQPVTEEIVADNCTLHCTNHGRYCLHPENRKFPGAEHVKEAARRMCLNYTTHDQSSSVMWEYLDAFDKAGCNTAQYEKNLSGCSFRAIDQLQDISRDDVQKCLDEAGGFDGDQRNMALSDQLKEQDHQHVSATSRYPTLKIDGQRYEGNFYVKDVFKAVCNAFPANDKPFSCHFCEKCSNVRKCLWQMECDGKAPSLSDFGVHDDLQHGANHTTNDPSVGSKSSSSEKSSGVSPGPWQTGFLWGVVAGLVVAAVFAFKELRTRWVVEDLQRSRKHFEDDFVPHGSPNLDTIVEALDIKKHGPASSECATPSSSDSTTQPPSDDEEDVLDISLPSIV